MQLDLILNLTKQISGTSEQIYQRQIVDEFYDCVVNYSDTIVENNPKDSGELLYKIMSHFNGHFVLGLKDEVEYTNRLDTEQAAILLLLDQLQRDMDECYNNPQSITASWDNQQIVAEFGYNSIQVTSAVFLAMIEVYISIYNFVNNSMFKKVPTDKFYNMVKSKFSMEDLKDMLNFEYESPFFISE